MTVEQIAIRQEIRQMLNEAGINKNTMKEMVREVIDEELNKAVKQVMCEMDTESMISGLANYNFEEKIRKELRSSIDTRVNSIFNRMKITIDIKNNDGGSSITSD
jgi:ethanolamine utilization protein EutQ (cupin superfamily)